MHTVLILNIQVHNHDFILGNYNIILGLQILIKVQLITQHIEIDLTREDGK